MERLPICRICLAENVRLCIVTNRNLHKLYEKLTDIPFVTEDYRPILACVFCCTKLKQYYRFMRQCLEAEELFAQMTNEDYKPNPLRNQIRLQFCNRLITSPMWHISIEDEYETGNAAIKEELPAVSDGLDNLIEPKEEHQSDELEPEYLGNSSSDVAEMPPQYYESDLEDDVPLMELRTKVETEEVPQKKQRARRKKKLEPEHLGNSTSDVTEIRPYYYESDLEDDVPLMELRTDVKNEEVSQKKRGARGKKRNCSQAGPFTDINEYEIITSRRGRKSVLLRAGYKYNKERQNQDGSCVWRCTKRTICKARLVIDGDNCMKRDDTHDCLPEFVCYVK